MSWSTWRSGRACRRRRWRRSGLPSDWVAQTRRWARQVRQARLSKRFCLGFASPLCSASSSARFPATRTAAGWSWRKTFPAIAHTRRPECHGPRSLSWSTWRSGRARRRHRRRRSGLPSDWVAQTRRWARQVRQARLSKRHYLDFASPLLLSVFLRQVPRDPDGSRVVLEEAFPATAHPLASNATEPRNTWSSRRVLPRRRWRRSRPPSGWVAQTRRWARQARQARLSKRH